MSDEKKKIEKITVFIEEYFKYSQINGRERMYGSLEQLESNWILLDKLKFILEDLEDYNKDFNFSKFLIYKGYGASSASSLITKMNLENPYNKLTEIWKEYEIWKSDNIKSKISHKT